MILACRAPRPTPSPGFTLIELLLATVIATSLLAALYLALNMTLQQVQTSRNAVEVEARCRGRFTR
ncbi:MAG: prepilin-type N-terminal cleavage/methylation domain-containing protein, partial [Gemmataceae bacterium]|nr:prepilin-type N-terminal cleavage/methylation domain-containing protein [Gemmataceae bacterium]